MQKPEGFVEEKTKRTMRAAVRDTARGTPEYHQVLHHRPPFFHVGTKSLSESSCNVILQKGELGVVRELPKGHWKLE